MKNAARKWGAACHADFISKQLDGVLADFEKRQADDLAAGLSQEELAIRMGVEQGYVSSLEAGKRNPAVLTLWHAAIALGVAPDRFLRSKELRSKPSAAE